MYVKPKKGLGQHFLKDKRVADRIVESFIDSNRELGPLPMLEVGPGTGVLTSRLIESGIEAKFIEIDEESIAFLRANYPVLGENLIEGDFLKLDITTLFDGNFALIGNFPYNISSQIFFKVLENHERVPLIVGMLQREVAERLAAPPGSKIYGILSVLLQCWYDIEYLFTVDATAFNPPPKVKSGVIRLTHNGRSELGCDPQLFKRVVKATFNQRRKTIRNSLKSLFYSLTQSKGAVANIDQLPADFLKERPERLSVEQFVELTNAIEESLK